MTSVNLEKTFEYLKIQESLRSENITKYYLCKGLFLCFSLLWKILYNKYKVKQINELAKPYDYLLKTHLIEMFFV